MEMKKIKDWQEKEGMLTATYQAKTFLDALGHLNKIAVLAEEAQHHPDVIIHEYNKLTIKLKTHDQSKITEKDHSLAKEIDQI